MNVMQFNAGQFNKPQLGPQSPSVSTNDLLPLASLEGESLDVGFELNPMVAVVNQEPEITIADTVEDGFFKQDTTSEEASNVIGDPSQSLLSFLTISQPIIPSEPTLEPMIGRAAIDGSQTMNATTNNVSAKVAEEPLTQGQKREQATKQLLVTPQFFAKSLVATDNSNKMITTQANVELTQKVVALVSERSNQSESHQNINQNSQQFNTTVDTNDKGINWSPLKLKGSTQEMAEQLHTALRERLQIQADNRIQQATIRLDPPALGKVDILVNLDAGKLNIQINSNHAEVQRALQQISGELRQQLVEQNFVQVNVQVSSQNSQQGEGQARQQRNNEEQIISADEFTHQDRTQRFDDSILTTV